MSTELDEIVQPLRLKPDEGSWARGTKLIGSLKAAVGGAVAGFISFKTVQTVGHWIEQTAEVGDNAVKAAQKLGITAEAYQELSHAAELSGVSQEGLQTALGKLAMNLDDVAVKGKGPAADALKRLGIKFKELKGESLDQNLEVIAERFKAMPDGMKKASLAVDLFGKQGRELIPLLNEGKEGIVELRNEAEELGIVIGADSAKAMEKFNDDQERLKKTFVGLRNQVVTALLPSLQEGVDGLRAWVAENREAIKSTLQQAMRGVIAGVRLLGRAFAALFKFIDEHHEEIAAVFQTVVDILTAAVDIVKFVAKVIVGAISAITRFAERVKRLFVHDIPEAIKGAFKAAWEFIGNLPVVKQIRELIERLDDLRNPNATSNFENAASGNQTGGKFLGVPIPFKGESENDFNQRLEDNMRERRREFEREHGPNAQPTGPLSINGGDVHITINGAQDPLALNKQIRSTIDDQMNSWLLQTREALS